MTTNTASRFPRSAKYNQPWVMAHGMGSNPLWLAEWLCEGLPLAAGMRVLDLGCGKALSSIFLAREFDVQVWATDLWVPASDNLERIIGAAVEATVFPIHADARSLPFAGDFFDAIVCLDAYPYFATDALYLNYLAHFVKPGGLLGIAGAGLMQPVDRPVPEHLAPHWTQDYWALQTVQSLRALWERTGIVDILVSDTMADGGQVWLDWHRQAHPHNTAEILQLEADAGRYLGYVRQVGRRRADAKLESYCWPDTLLSMGGLANPYPELKPDA